MCGLDFTPGNVAFFLEIFVKSLDQYRELHTSYQKLQQTVKIISKVTNKCDKLPFRLMDNAMKKWNSYICAMRSSNRAQGADRGQASASGEAVERAQIEFDHKGSNMQWSPRYCQHSCPIQ